MAYGFYVSQCKCLDARAAASGCILAVAGPGTRKAFVSMRFEKTGSGDAATPWSIDQPGKGSPIGLFSRDVRSRCSPGFGFAATTFPHRSTRYQNANRWPNLREFHETGRLRKCKILKRLELQEVLLSFQLSFGTRRGENIENVCAIVEHWPAFRMHTLSNYFHGPTSSRLGRTNN
jgi:hypothetical protein